MHTTELLVQSQHLLGVRSRVVALLSVASFYTNQESILTNEDMKYVPWCLRSRIILTVSGRRTTLLTRPAMATAAKGRVVL